MITLITPALLRSLHVSAARAALWAPELGNAAEMYCIDTPLRVAGWLAQLMHESCELAFVAEIWGPTAAQRGYEGRVDLGNTAPGDGRRFAGHGPIQTTGRANHRRVTRALRARGILCPDFEADPLALCLPEWGSKSAGLFWSDNGLNAYADRRDIDGMSSIVNTGRPGRIANGLPDRRLRYTRALAALSVSSTARG